MKKGYLSEYFRGVGFKYLSAVEACRHRSNQHEFDGVNKLRGIFGVVQNGEKKRFSASFIYLSDDDDEPVEDEGFLTWYDSRWDKPYRSAEYRLYFPTTKVSYCADEGDLLIVGMQQTGDVLVIIAEAGSTISSQLLWLFGFSDDHHAGYSVKGEIESNQIKLEFASRYILERIGIESVEEDQSFLDIMLQKFGGDFPSTKVFSDFARSTVTEVTFSDDPDIMIVSWLEREEILFRTLEKFIIGERLSTGFDDVDDFLHFSLSVQNRRKSRAGTSLENHLEVIFNKLGLCYSRGAVTEGKSKPDFIFPNILKYRDPNFSPHLLTMLGSKTTCKDRWRQVLNEADRITHKHLFTIEPSISENQTDEMQRRNLQLVLPEKLHSSYLPKQREWLWNLTDFIDFAQMNRKNQECKKYVFLRRT
jgi:hypothetical protein